MILKNRKTSSSLEIEYSEFRKKFAKEIQKQENHLLSVMAADNAFMKLQFQQAAQP